MCALRLPKQELDINQYLQSVKSALEDQDCAIFIDTNVLSQLYKLNDSARSDFYDWVDHCGSRFHVPAWVVHEYSHRVYENKTSDYLSELSSISTINKNFENVSKFLKGYIGDAFLVGSQYQDNKDDFERDVDTISTTLGKISNAISKNKVEEHKRKVQEEIRNKIESRVLDSDIFQLLQEAEDKSNARYANRVPPGFMDDHKQKNCIGDLIIWKEILCFCKNNRITKAVLISRDTKCDIVYCPDSQKRDGRIVSNNNEKVSIAKESLIYEFSTHTGSEDFFVVNFYTLVRMFANRYQKLAISFQIAMQNEECTTDSGQSPTDDELVLSQAQPIIVQVVPSPIQYDDLKEIQDYNYSEYALADNQYDSHIDESDIGHLIKGLKIYNWYRQNDTIDQISSSQINSLEDNQASRDALFVLGRNIVQCFDGTAARAIDFVSNLSSRLNNWKSIYRNCLIDGMLYEVYFSSTGVIREKGFKASCIDTLIAQIKIIKDYQFDFINNQLECVKTRFVPTLGDGQKYQFEFKFEKNVFKNLFCNGKDVSSIITDLFLYGHIPIENIKESLSCYFGIPISQIVYIGIPEGVSAITNYIPPSDGTINNNAVPW